MPPRTDPQEITLPKARIRCVLVHDHVLLRQGLRRLLEDEPDIDVVSEAGNAAECLRKVFDLRPDVVVADAETLGLTASEAQLCVSRESPRTKIVFLSAQHESVASSLTLHAVKAICAVRQTSVEELVEMVRNAFFGETAASLDAVPDWEKRRPVERDLTLREREVLKLLAQGKTVRTAATALGLSSKTVDSHKFNLMRKLGIHNKAELVMWAVQKKVVKVPVNF